MDKSEYVYYLCKHNTRGDQELRKCQSKQKNCEAKLEERFVEDIDCQQAGRKSERGREREK